MMAARPRPKAIVDRRFLGLLCAALALGWVAAPASAMSWPDEPGLYLSPMGAADPAATDALSPAPPGLLPSLKDLEESLGAERSMTMDPRLFLAAAEAAPVGGEKPATPPVAESPAPPEGKGAEAAPGPNKHCPPPLPLFNIEGVGGTLLVPMAYLINCESPGTTVGMPTAGYTFVRAGTKSVQEVHVAETFFRRIEIGYTMGTLNLGDFPRDVRRATGIDIGFQHVVLHNFNVRGIVIEEGKCNPAVTAGATFKYNPNVQTIDRRLFGGIRALGMARSNSTDFTLTATKTIIEPCLKRPVLVTGGVRLSEAAQLGYLGFGDTYRLTGEGSVAYVITDWLAIAYEYRQKKNPYDTLGRLAGKEGAWQAVDFAFILTPHMTFAVGWLCAGNVANGRVDNGWGCQLKYEF